MSELLSTFHVKTSMNKYILTFLITCSFQELASKDISNIEIISDQIWSLHKKSNKLSVTNSEVLYFMPNAALKTLQARRFNNWDQFSFVDSRNLVRLNKGDSVKIVESMYYNKIYKVQLLDGLEKNREFFVITKDLRKNFKITENQQ